MRRHPRTFDKVQCDRCARTITESPMFGTRRHKCPHGQPCYMISLDDGRARCEQCRDEAGRLKQIRENLADGYLGVYRADSQAAFGRLLSDTRHLLFLYDSRTQTAEQLQLSALRRLLQDCQAWFEWWTDGHYGKPPQQSSEMMERLHAVLNPSHLQEEKGAR